MSSYTPNIPQPGDDPSDSQDQLLQNFQTLNTIYGSSGDHYPWTNTTPTEGLRHAKVRLPGLPTANPPGNIIPTPGPNEGVMFGLTAGGETYPFWRRDSQIFNIPMAAFRAFGRANALGFVGNSFNLTSINQSPTGTWTFNLTNPEADATYLVLATPFDRTSGDPAACVQSIGTGSFVVSVFGGASNGIMAAAIRLTL